MRTKSRTRGQRKEAGIALLIAIFVLLLISVVAIALIVSSGTETAMAGNYRSSTAVYYAALAGLEEARGRLSFNNPNAFTTTAPPGFVPSPGPLTTGQVRYVLNPAPSENAGTLLANYPDTEYDLEFAPNTLATATANGNVQTIASVSGVGGVQGPLYKWVRINAVSEYSLKVNFDGQPNDATTPVYYDGTQPSGSRLNRIYSGAQVLEITSLAALPNGSQKLLQYLVALGGSPLNLSFPSALTLDGPVGTFFPSANPNFWVNGVDRQGNPGPYPMACPPNDPNRPAVGVTGQGLVNQVTNSIAAVNSPPDHYPGLGPNPSVGIISSYVAPALQDVNSLERLVQTITGLADDVIPASSTPANGLPYADLGTQSMPVTTVVQGDLWLSGVSGYGLLLVTGNLVLNGDVSWNGVILVIGQGSLSIPSPGNGKIIGAVVVAKTRDSNGNPLNNLGQASFKMCLTSTCNAPDANNGNGGFYYDSCWIQAVLPPAGYKVLSFHEIAQ